MEHEERMAYMDETLCQTVWQRVAPELDPYPRGGEEPLAMAERRVAPTTGALTAEAIGTAIEEELSARRDYQSCARRMSGTGGRTLCCLAERSARRVRHLTGLYFLVTGRSYGRAVACPLPEGSCCALLRRRYYAEMAAAERYERWAERTEDSHLACTLNEMAQGARQSAGTVWYLLENALAQ